jgi:hypothetical protein
MLYTKRENRMSVDRFGLDPDGKLGFSDDDVVMFQGNNFNLDKMTKVGSLIKVIGPWAMSNSNNTGYEFGLFDKGLECEILRVSGGGWQKGRFRVRLEFIPDDPESFMGIAPEKTSSPLDDLRSNLDI